ncbi:MAG: quinone-dependent dihydroorotate dehydrogenase [Rhodospirillaceae bacterium]|jgi:dihydroorotate dehydrogenase|nr:quinone-dependent dihydroorotate dehydrogenase [Rhodospirillaceae bacterium]MBT5455504.1 quinone-dependent dihydroorotate dehydrogenase [Rhodospirillaceae bacterium]
MSSAGLNTAFRATSAPRRRPFDAANFGTALLRHIPPNLAHKTAIKALRYGLLPPKPRQDDSRLSIRVWGIDFTNPLGMAAGFDKNGEATDGLLGLGFGFVEAGTVTPRPQPGNPRPNLFRLEEDSAVINRLGIPSPGIDVFADNLKRLRDPAAGPVGANIGFNAGSEDPLQDVITSIRVLAPLVDYLVLNVSCPNTPGMCDWQAPEKLEAFLVAAVAAGDESPTVKPPLLVKIAPDLDSSHLRALAGIVVGAGIDGVIATNTTVTRPATLRSEKAHETGGLSGPVLFDQSLRNLRELYRLTEGCIPLIGCGGISSGKDAYAKIRAGASLIQLYTALIYGGPGLVADIKASLLGHLRADGFDTVAQAVGADHR